MQATRAVLVMVIALTLGCATGPKTVKGTKGKQKTSVLFINGKNAKQALWVPDGLNPDGKAVEKEIAKVCGATENDRRVEGRMGGAGLAAGAAAAVLKEIVKFVIEKIDESLQKKLKKYTAAFAGAGNQSLYRAGAANGPALQYKCFRFTRYFTDTDGSEQVAVDLVGEFKIETREALKVRPLRLYYARRIAKSKDDKVGVAISARMDAVYRRNVDSKRAEKVVDTVLLGEKVLAGKETNRSPIWYRSYMQKDWTQYPPQKLPPWSVYDGVKSGGSHVTLTISVAEAGNVPWLLENSAKLFHDNKDDIVKLLQEAAESAISNEPGAGS